MIPFDFAASEVYDDLIDALLMSNAPVRRVEELVIPELARVGGAWQKEIDRAAGLYLPPEPPFSDKQLYYAQLALTRHDGTQEEDSIDDL